MSIAFEDPNGQMEWPINLYTFGFDQLNRITYQKVYRDNSVEQTTTWNPTPTDNFQTSYSYDGNGNLLSLFRNGHGTLGTQEMDRFSYVYQNGTNRLLHVDDDLQISGNFDEDIDDQTQGNYAYDLLGNLTYDRANQIDEIIWNTNNRIRDVNRVGSLSTFSIFYDVNGNKFARQTKNGATENEWKYFYSIRDPQGNNLATIIREYHPTESITEPRISPSTSSDFVETLKISDFQIYGSSHIGTEWVSDEVLLAAAEFNQGSFNSQGYFIIML